jgi:hypothetical protein
LIPAYRDAPQALLRVGWHPLHVLAALYHQFVRKNRLVWADVLRATQIKSFGLNPAPDSGGGGFDSSYGCRLESDGDLLANRAK